jgi:hypothetical protein
VVGTPQIPGLMLMEKRYKSRKDDFFYARGLNLKEAKSKNDLFQLCADAVSNNDPVVIRTVIVFNPGK